MSSTMDKAGEYALPLGKSVVLVETDPDMRKLLTGMIFTRSAMRVRPAASFSEAMQQVFDDPTDVAFVVMDEVAARDSTEKTLVNYLLYHPEIKAKFILFSDHRDPNWPGEYLPVIPKTEFTALLDALK